MIIDRSKGTLVMATNSDFPPYEYKAEDGSVIGFDADLMNAVCDELGYVLEIHDMALDSVLPAVKSEKADVAAAGISVVTTHLVVMVRKN